MQKVQSDTNTIQILSQQVKGTNQNLVNVKKKNISLRKEIVEIEKAHSEEKNKIQAKFNELP